MLIPHACLISLENNVIKYMVFYVESINFCMASSPKIVPITCISRIFDVLSHACFTLLLLYVKVIDETYISRLWPDPT